MLDPDAKAQIRNIIGALSQFCERQRDPFTGQNEAVRAFDEGIIQLKQAKVNYQESIWEGPTD